MSSNRDETLQQFCDITGTDESRSRFFLESSNWQLDVALSSFYENGGNVDEAPSNPAAVVSVPPLSDSDVETPPGSPPQARKDKKKPGNPKFATLDTLQQDSSSEDEGQAFYAGGSERSGQQIIGPGKGRKDIVTEVFKSVRERGAVVFEDEASTAGRGGGGLFSGVGYRLGQTSDDHEEVTAPAAANASEPSSARCVRLRLYRAGYTVDGGALRSYAQPEHAEFLNCIRRGEIPPELSCTGGEVRVSLEDRRHEECPRNVSKPAAFTGKGHLLGSPTPPTVGATVALATNVEDRAANLRAAQRAVKLDESAPTTTIQFRLLDGTSLTGRFNETHTVGDLRQYICLASPASQLAPFRLLSGYPSAELADDTCTLRDAGLHNCTVLQRDK